MFRPVRHRLDTGSSGSSRSSSPSDNAVVQQTTNANPRFTLEIECDDIIAPPELVQSQDIIKEQFRVNEGVRQS
ncbi:hypothetical protein Y032_0042g622 [Ancylostoma ceylanicum]|uniref:Uncharacterized protein n=1 Tax=Ancylostoma ceylanicum TaxID=53326 RepID=A0A016UGK0_9BILA|nr:hypothetical protein Y032_0042g622 [Ancylostoma ceylanicum]